MILPAIQGWYRENVEKPQAQARADKAARIKTIASKPKEPATEDDLAAIKAIADVRFIPGSTAKRFARDLQGATELTGRQRLFLWDIVWTFRRQIADKGLVTKAQEMLEVTP